MWEVVARGRPYKDKGYCWIKEIKEAVLAGVRPTCPSHVSENYEYLMSQCWITCPSERPNFTEIVQHLETMLAQVSRKEYVKESGL